MMNEDEITSACKWYKWGVSWRSERIICNCDGFVYVIFDPSVLIKFFVTFSKKEKRKWQVWICSPDSHQHMTTSSPSVFNPDEWNNIVGSSSPLFLNKIFELKLNICFGTRNSVHTPPSTSRIPSPSNLLISCYDPHLELYNFTEQASVEIRTWIAPAEVQVVNFWHKKTKTRNKMIKF